MRSSDEHQHGSTRPNLLSGGRRRFSGDDNILERLERDSARHASGNRSRAAWYAASASLVLLVVIFVAWMAFDNANTVQIVPMARAPVDVAPVVAISDPPALAHAQAAPSAPSPLAEASSPPLADAPTSHARDGAIATLPPLVLLEGHEAGTHHAVRSDQVKARAPVTPAPRVKLVAQAHAQADTLAPQTAPARTVAKPAPGTRARRLALATPTEPPVDTDVALLSAIIIHDSTHAAEKAQLEAAAVCARNVEKKCASRSQAGRD